MNRPRVRKLTGIAVSAIRLAIIGDELDMPYWRGWSLSLIGSGIFIGVALEWAGIIGNRSGGDPPGQA